MLKKYCPKNREGGILRTKVCNIAQDNMLTFYYIKFNILPLGVSIEYKKNNFMVSFNSNYDKILIKYDTAIVYLQFSMLLKITWQSLYITKSRSSICTIKICCKSCYSINRKGGILVYSPPSKLIRSRNSTCTI